MPGKLQQLTVRNAGNTVKVYDTISKYLQERQCGPVMKVLAKIQDENFKTKMVPLVHSVLELANQKSLETCDSILAQLNDGRVKGNLPALLEQLKKVGNIIEEKETKEGAKDQNIAEFFTILKQRTAQIYHFTQIGQMTPSFVTRHPELQQIDNVRLFIFNIPNRQEREPDYETRVHVAVYAGRVGFSISKGVGITRKDSVKNLWTAIQRANDGKHPALRVSALRVSALRVSDLSEDPTQALEELEVWAPWNNKDIRFYPSSMISPASIHSDQPIFDGSDQPTF